MRHPIQTASFFEFQTTHERSYDPPETCPIWNTFLPFNTGVTPHGWGSELFEACELIIVDLIGSLNKLSESICVHLLYILPLNAWNERFCILKAIIP